MKREREITITRERIKQLLDRHRGRKYVPEDFQPLMPLEEEDVLRLALRATDPEYVMVPIMDVIEIGKEPFKDGACEQCYPRQDYTKSGFRCVYHEATDKYRAHFQGDQP